MELRNSLAKTKQQQAKETNRHRACRPLNQCHAIKGKATKCNLKYLFFANDTFIFVFIVLRTFTIRVLIIEY
jgi:hypothetical protein